MYILEVDIYLRGTFAEDVVGRGRAAGLDDPSGVVAALTAALHVVVPLGIAWKRHLILIRGEKGRFGFE